MTKILLVEDDKSLREIYGVRLSAEGYEILSAGDGEEALAIASKEQPDLVICDVMMPKISGFDVLDILRSTPATKNMKVIMMTALSSEDQRARGESLGADKYLVKSQVGIEDVIRTVHEVLEDAPIAPGAPASAPTAPAPQPDTVPAPTAPTEPSPVPEPAQEPEQPLPPPVASTPAAPAAPQPAPVPEPVIEPVIPPIPTPPVPPVETPVVNEPLPQPTAPFSSPAPESLGTQVADNAQAAQQVPTPPPTPPPVVPPAPISPAGPQQSIEPLPAPANTDNEVDDIAKRIEQELNGAAPDTTPPPTPPPA